MCESDVVVNGFTAMFYYNVHIQIVNMTRNNDIHFCKGFWGLAENSFMHVSLLLL